MSAWGIPWSSEEFVQQAALAGACRSAWCVGRIAHSMVDWFKRWTSRAKELQALEQERKQRMEDNLRAIVAPKLVLTRL